MIITIGREFGSGGSEIGRKLAERLGYAYYDKNMIDQVAEKLGFSPEYVKKVEEKPTGSFLFSMAMYSYGGYSGTMADGTMPAELQVSSAQTQFILEKAEEGSCVFVGRCADYLLKDRNDVLRIFIYSDIKSKVERVMARYQMDEKTALRTIQQTDKQRASYYNTNTQNRWGAKESYDLLMDSGTLGVDGTVDILERICRAKQN